jgi:hypothetical protein
MQPPLAYTTTPHDPAAAQPSMADVFASFDPATGLASQVQGRIAMPDAPLVPVVVADTPVEQRLRTLPHAEPVAWVLLKHAVQAALAASVVLFVVHGGTVPGMALAYVATGLLLMGTVVVADRMRFLERDLHAFELVDVVGPEVAASSIAHDVQVVSPPVAPLVPLVEQMQVVMPGGHVTVT